ncbi:MAG: hypothetical protein DMG97_10910 [Acidobacteria bacterium]|nr:MAG: hypothetical protein DME33_14685 [Verrucomicrobiota bacterium]PYV73604.1 MAG: hypothetical protein DMG97_10910 [Acidobacteriota bacterium]
MKLPNWRDKTIFVTGATGFIGGRVCERLVMAGARHVRALVHSMHRAARIGRLPIELCPGDLLDLASLRSALGDSKIVIHCGLGNARAIVRGTENVLGVAAARSVDRFVHMSTTAVYGISPPPGCETEQAPLRRSGDGYCDNKAKAEGAVFKFARRGLPAVILRPAIVYGPYSAWSTRLIPALREGRVALIDGGRGACNTTYVDNLIDAVFLAIENQCALGKTFFITDGETITWGDFIQAHVAMLGQSSDLPQVSKEEAIAYYKNRPGLVLGSMKAAGSVLRSKEFRRLLMQIPVSQRILAGAWRWLESLPEGKRARIRSRVGVRRQVLSVQNGRFMPDEITVATQTSTVFFRIDKAREILGYSPRVPFAQGIRLVERWLRFANYI